MFLLQEIALGSPLLPPLCVLSALRVKTAPRHSTHSPRARLLSRPFRNRESRSLPFDALAKSVQPSHSKSLRDFLFPLCFQRLAASFAPPKVSSSLFSIRCRLLRKNMELFCLPFRPTHDNTSHHSLSLLQSTLAEVPQNKQLQPSLESTLTKNMGGGLVIVN